MKLVQCWDDGVTSDARLVEILRRHGARASFNLNAGLHQPRRQPGWIYQDVEVQRLALGELREVYAGFTIANHSLSHPHLDRLDITEARREIHESRDRLQQLFGQPVRGFAYPYGAFNAAVAEAVRDAGHLYARTVASGGPALPPADPMTLAPSCHFLAPDFWARLEAARGSGVFYFWGHSYELTSEAMWTAFDAALARLGAEPGASWCELAELFEPGQQSSPP